MPPLEAYLTTNRPVFRSLTSAEATRYRDIQINPIDTNGLGLPISREELEMVRRVVTWADLSPVLRVEGRSMFVPSTGSDVMPYDTSQIGGTCCEPIVVSDQLLHAVLVDSRRMIEPPTTYNILDIAPRLSQTARVMKDGTLRVLESRRRYAGGYTKSELDTKVFNTLRVARLNDRPFLSPLPIAQGRYRRLNGPEGPICFWVTRVPDQGIRTGDVIIAYSNRDTNDYTQVSELFNDALRNLGVSLRYLHEKGLTHGQPHLGNCLAWKDHFFLGDFATLAQLNHPMARALDLYQTIRSAMGALGAIKGGPLHIAQVSDAHFESIQIDELTLAIFNGILSELLSGYFGRSVSVHVNGNQANTILRGPSKTGPKGRAPGPALDMVYRIINTAL